jgi:hypothetical protein
LQKAKEEKPKAQGESGSGKTESSGANKPTSGALFMVIDNSFMATSKSLSESFYVDLGASAHIIPSRGGLWSYVEFVTTLEIAAANSGKIYTYGSGTVCVATLASGIKCKADLEDVYYAPDMHVQLLSLGKLKGQGWDICLKDGGMELCNRDGDLFAVVSKVNNVNLMELSVMTPSARIVAWMDDGVQGELTHQDIVGHLNSFAMAATVRGGKGSVATLMTWHHQLGHLSFKTVIELAKSGMSRMVISDIPVKILGLNVYVACVVGKLIHLLHKEGCRWASEYLEHMHMDIAGSMPVASLGGQAYLFIIIDDYSCVVYTRLLCQKSEVARAFRVFKVVAEAESGKQMHEVLMDNACKLSMGEMHWICEESGVKLNTMVSYHPASNGVAEHTIRVLTNAIHTMLHDSGLPKSLWAEAFSMAMYIWNRTPMSALEGCMPYKMVYNIKPDFEDLHTFSVLCANVKLSEMLEKSDGQVSLCMFIEYKYGGGGYRVWDPRRSVVVELRDITFFEEGLPPPTYCNLAICNLRCELDWCVISTSCHVPACCCHVVVEGHQLNISFFKDD